jgi:hypothetical protein
LAFWFLPFSLLLTNFTESEIITKKMALTIRMLDNLKRLGSFILDQYILTDHALMEMRRREITKDDVKKVMTSPEQRIDVRKGRCVYQSKLAFGEPTREYLVRVFVDIDREPNEVVTVYRTSRIDKYWR